MSGKRDDAPERPTMPAFGKGRRRAGGDDDLIDDGPTVFDPGVPTGAPGFPAQLGTDDEPTGAKEKVSLETVVGKRALKQTLKNPGKIERPVDPRELPTQRHQMPLPAGPRIDESARTNKWEADELPTGDAPMRDSGPPTNPLPDRVAPAAVPRSGAQVPLPLAPGPQSAPIRAISMKTPAEVEADDRALRALPQVRIRAISELNPHALPPQGMGYLAPPRDPNVARPRRWQDLVIWGSVAVMVAAVVTLAVWFLAR